jgi:RimJ/RimL family protein N-acetyltransferase
LEDIKRVLDRYESLKVPKQDARMFAFHLTQDRSSWFLEVGDVGLVYFTGVVPRVGATINVLFWDGKLGKARVALVREAIRLVVERFALERVGAQIKWSNKDMRDFLKRVGLIWEGTIRKAWVDRNGCEDMLMLGLIKEEL